MKTVMWPNTKITDLFDIEIPIIQAPMAGSTDSNLAIAVSEAGGLGSLPCALLSAEKALSEINAIKQATRKPFNVNFFCHTPPIPDPEKDLAWKKYLKKYYDEAGLDDSTPIPSVNRAPFDDTMCEVIEECQPKVVSFHFGLPDQKLFNRVKATGALILSSATTVAEARWLEENGCDVIIAQGVEAGGHRGMFLTQNISTQPGTMALVPQVVDAVSIPVIAAGGIGDGRGIVASFALGAAAVQIGTAYLLTPEAITSQVHRAALKEGTEDQTALTNIFSGRPARGLMNRLMREIGPISPEAPAFPTAGGALAPLKLNAEPSDCNDFSSLWSGQASALANTVEASVLTKQFADEALSLFSKLTR